MASTRFQIGTAAVLTLVALRLGIGWHFFKEGAKKLQDPDWSASVFFETAKGPVAPLVQRLVPDRTGRARLDRQATRKVWESYCGRAVSYYGFDQQQQKQADRILKQWLARLDQFHKDNREAIDEYFLELQRVRDSKADTTTREVAFQRDWIAGKEAELRATLRGFTSQLQSMDRRLQNDLYAVANQQQRQRGALALPRRSRSVLDTVVKYFITAVGACLILGLLTRTASLGGAAFLMSVIATQPPWVAGAETSYFYYQMVELLALLLLAATGAGRFAGLDFFVYSVRRGCCLPDKGDQP
jgi:uncharacterized membrane protein YphA (DoxX/SURF4 family)